jgi:predicted cobalt transporter CbtA
MTAETAIVISGVVALLVQIVKLSGVERKWGMFWSLGFSVVAVALYGISNEPVLTRQLIWPYFCAIATVAASAVGIHSASKNTTEMVKDAAFKAEIKRYNNGDGV